jgi:hypothetical protein
MDKILHVWTTTLLLTFATLAVATTKSPADTRANVAPLQVQNILAPIQAQNIVAPTRGRDVVAKFECRSRGPSTGEILLKADGQYSANDKMGRYSTFRLGYRLIGGSLRGQSIVRQQSSIYLVSTKDEAKAAELAAVDRALLCTGGEIRY